jgi:hypothetical protein
MPAVLAPRRIPRPQIRPRLAWLLLGAVLARGRRTVTSWIRAAGLTTQFRPCYTTVAAAGKKAKDSLRPPGLQGSQALGRRPSEPHVGTRRLDDSSGTGGLSREPASITTRLPARRVRHIFTATSGWYSGSWRSIPCGESSRCRFWLGCTSERRTCPRSTRNIGPGSKPSWRRLPSCYDGALRAQVPGQATADRFDLASAPTGLRLAKK